MDNLLLYLGILLMLFNLVVIYLIICNFRTIWRTRNGIIELIRQKNLFSNELERARFESDLEGKHKKENHSYSEDRKEKESHVVSMDYNYFKKCKFN